MNERSQLKITALNEFVDEVWGAKGTPEREEMEAQLKEELHAYKVDGVNFPKKIIRQNFVK